MDPINNIYGLLAYTVSAISVCFILWLIFRSK